MKKLCALMLALLLASGAFVALSEAGVEVIRVDGIGVAVILPTETRKAARMIAKSEEASLTLPAALAQIDAEAFVGIAAVRVEVTENVVSIASRAFADCEQLREIIIPATVLSVDDHALDGCADVTVYGTKGTEAERFANAAGFAFVDPNAAPDAPVAPEVAEVETQAIVLPFVTAN